MGVLTKPDLAIEMATKNAVMDLLLGKRSKLTLGYYVVKNRSADDSNSGIADRDAAETAFFTGLPWSYARERCGLAALKSRLIQLVMKISNQEFPSVKADIAQKLADFRHQLETMGPSRGDQNTQRVYLGKLASRFQAIARDAMKGYYIGESIFTESEDMRLVTRIFTLCERFSTVFVERSHLDVFCKGAGDAVEAAPAESTDTESSESHCDDGTESSIQLYEELGAVLEEEGYQCPKPLESSSLTARIRAVYLSSRGPELGTVSSD